MIKKHQQKKDGHVNVTAPINPPPLLPVTGEALHKLLTLIHINDTLWAIVEL